MEEGRTGQEGERGEPGEGQEEQAGLLGKGAHSCWREKVREGLRRRRGRSQESGGRSISTLPPWGTLRSAGEGSRGASGRGRSQLATLDTHTRAHRDKHTCRSAI